MISSVPADGVALLWNDVAPLIQKAVDRTPGRYEAVDILTDAMLGNAQLWIDIHDDKIRSAGITRIYDTPLARVLSIQWLGGDELAEWQVEASEVTESFARDNGCTRIEIVGRRGWGKLVKGFTELNTTFEKVL